MGTFLESVLKPAQKRDILRLWNRPWQAFGTATVLSEEVEFRETEGKGQELAPESEQILPVVSPTIG